MKMQVRINRYWLNHVKTNTNRSVLPNYPIVYTLTNVCMYSGSGSLTIQVYNVGNCEENALTGVTYIDIYHN